MIASIGNALASYWYEGGGPEYLRIGRRRHRKVRYWTI